MSTSLRSDTDLHITQSSTLPPAQPTYVLRGHSAQVHAVHFCRSNLRLVTGDADGWIVFWDLPIKRAVSVWKGHTATILTARSWDGDKIITHGRDGKLKVWQLRPEDESAFSKILPVESQDGDPERERPWLLHSLDVNAMNFCSFAMCLCPINSHLSSKHNNQGRMILVATPGVHDGTLVLTTLPDEARHSNVPVPRGVNVGMVMAIALVPTPSLSDSSDDNSQSGGLTVLAGYESGHAALWKLNSAGKWEMVYIHKAHTQPILSLAAAPGAKVWFSSSADAIIAQHHLFDDSREHADDEIQTVQTRHAGQQGLCMRSDEKIFATAGWDGRVRVYAVMDMRELAVLKWHREGCYALAFADSIDEGDGVVDRDDVSLQEAGREKGTGSEIAQRRPFTIAQQRLHKARKTHWLAAGSKDGKVSLWDIY